MMPVKPSVRGIMMIIICLAAFGSALVNANLATCLVAACFCAICISSFFLAFFSLYQIELRRLTVHDGVLGGQVSLPVEIKNLSNRYRQSVIIREQCPFSKKKWLSVATIPLRPLEKTMVNRHPWAVVRGRFQLSAIFLRGGDPAGLFFREKKLDLPVEVMVYPESVKLSYMPIRLRRQQLSSTSGRPIGVSGMGQEFFGVREHRPSDGIRFIHWRASAKHRKLMVREFESHTTTCVSIVLDIEKSMVGIDEFENNFEYLVKTVSSMVNYLAGMYCKVLFVTGASDGSESIRIEGDSFGVRTRINDYLAIVQPSAFPVGKLVDMNLEMFPANSIFYCLTMSESEDLGQSFDLLVERGVDIRWIYAPKKCFPYAERISAPPVESELTLQKKHFCVAPYVVRRDLNIARILSYG